MMFMGPRCSQILAKDGCQAAYATGVAERISLQHCNGVPIRPGKVEAP